MTIRPASERLSDQARLWNVTVSDLRRTETSLIAFGVRECLEVVVKVVKQPGEEWRSGELLRAFDGSGLVRALEHTEGAVLLERLRPGNDLVGLSMGRHDEEATEILAGIIKQMSSVRPGWPGALRVESFVSGFEKYGHSCDGMISSEIVEKAESLFRWLCASQGDRRLLHGDLHHYNVLFDSSRGWVATDPWGLEAEIEYEVGASLRNPIDAPSLVASTETLVRRLRIFEIRLGLNRKRALQWAYASTVLAALWPIEEDGKDMRMTFVTGAATMRSLLNAAEAMTL